MSVQWTLVATFLYAEIAVVILLLLPFISARAWHRFFKSKFLNSLGRQANVWFMVFVAVLVLLFVDSLREMKKYAFEREHDLSHGHLDAELQHSMRLFRAQRNFYIAGFALFLCLVVRRIVTLLCLQAQLEAQKEAALKQAQSASRAAEQLSAASAASPSSSSARRGGDEDNSESDNDKKSIDKLSKQLEAAQKEMSKLRASRDAMESQSKSLAKEYDRLSEEHVKLQRKVTISGADSKKDS